jgi:hypothetical protein
MWMAPSASTRIATRQSSAAWRAAANISWAFLRKGLTKMHIGRDSGNCLDIRVVSHSGDWGRKEDQTKKGGPMPQTVYVIGTLPHELRWLRMLVTLLRHPDPNVAELTRQALLYLTRSAAAPEEPEAHAADSREPGVAREGARRSRP